MSITAMKQALEALEKTQTPSGSNQWVSETKAVHALRTAIALAPSKPLTDEEIIDAWKQVYEPGHQLHVLVKRMARAIEAAHGIGGEA